MKNNKVFRILSAVMALTMIFNLFAISSSAASKKELQDKIENIQEERKNKEELLAALKNDVDKQEEYVETLYSQIDSIQEEIDLYQEKIDEMSEEVGKINAQIKKKNEQIKEVEEKMADKKAEIEEVKDLLAVRIRATYMAGSGSSLKLLFGAGDLASYLTTSEMLKRIADNDDKIVTSLVKKMEDLLKLQEKLAKQKEELSTQKTELEEKKAELEKEQQVVQASQDEVSAKYHEAYNILEKLDKESSFYKSQILALDREEEKLDKMIQQMIINSSKPSGGSSGSSGSNQNYAPTNNPSGYINPVPYSDAYISSSYGMRVNPVTGVYKMHSGIDISCGGSGGQTGPFTKKIVAAKAGTVTHVGWVSGYGNTVMITHDDGYLTLYAHNYSFNVSVGQRVSQGQQIAIMGSTGNSTGAHCHFEIRNGMWGTTVDPAPYI